MRILIVGIVAALLALHGSRASAAEAETVAKKTDTFTVDFPDTSIREIVQSVAEVSKLKVVIPDYLQGNTSIKLRDVTWRQIFKVVLQPADHEFIEYDDRVVILTTKDADALPWIEKEIELFFQKPAETVAHLQRALAFAKPILEARAQSIVIKVHPRFAKLAFEHIAKIDDPEVRLFKYPRKPFFPQTIPIPGETLPVRKSEIPPEITIALNNGETAKGRLASTEVFIIRWVDCEEIRKVVMREVPELFKIGTDARSNALVITSDHENLDRAQSIIEYLDDKRWYEPKTWEKK